MDTSAVMQTWILTLRQIEPFNPEDNTAGTFTDESRFSTLFPKYREQYLKGSWKFITASLKKIGIGCELNLVEGSVGSCTLCMRDEYLTTSR
jgi:hypothetical protein